MSGIDDDDFIIIDEDDDASNIDKTANSVESTPSVTESNTPLSSQSGMKNRLQKIKAGFSSQVDAVKDRLKPREKPSEDVIEYNQESGLNSTDIVFSIDGSHSFEWPILGMDCPDCASKAKRALLRLPGVTNVSVSATMGTVAFDIDLGVSKTSKAASVLGSLGHEADIPWHVISGINAASISKSRNIKRNEVRRLFMEIPGVLNVRVEDATIQLQLAPNSNFEVESERNSMLSNLVGHSVVLKEIEQTRLNSSQWRLVMTLPAIAILIVVISLDNSKESLLMFLTFIGVALSGWRMFADAIAGIQNRELGFQLLTSLAVIGALAGSHWSEALIVSILVAVASHMEESALKRARDSMQGGLDRLPRKARVILPNVTKFTVISEKPPEMTKPFSLQAAVPDCAQDDEMVSIDLVNVGDLVEIRSGEIVPVDGIVAEGIGSLNRAPLTGESIPIRVAEGDDVHAGLVLDRGPIVVKSTAVGDDTKLSGLIDEVRTFRESPPRIQGTLENFSRIWVPFVLAFSPLAALLLGDLRIMLLLWVVACPCSLLLAAPVPHAAALSTASRTGVVARGGHALEAASRVDLALLDKTGTLTSGHPKLDQIILADGIGRDHALRIASGLEKRSNHPYADAILKVAEKESVTPFKVTKLTDGEAGVQGSIKGKTVIFGRATWLSSMGIKIPSVFSNEVPDGHGASILSEDGEAIAAFTFIHDDLREGAAEMIHDLRAIGIGVELLSGDAQSAVEALGREVDVGAEHCRGEIDPNGKAVWVERRSQVRQTLMAGDGFNDAAALAAADLGIAVGSGEQVNLDAADVLIPGKDPRVISNFIRLARRTRGIVQMNLFISVAVTVLLIISVLAGIQTHLAVGVAIHEASVFIVILNGAFVASSGNRFALIGEIFADLARDYGRALGLLFTKSNPDPS